MPVELNVDGHDVVVARGDGSLLDALREELGVRGPKDGCSPQGQCGCCTVLVDGAARVACVTALRRVAGRRVVTVDGLPAERRDPIVAALVAAGGSQCGFCTPGIVCRVAAIDGAPTAEVVERALLAHLCRCTGWRSIVDAVVAAGDPAGGAPPAPPRSGPAGERADRRASIEGRAVQRTGPDAARGRAGFADDLAPRDALVAVPDGAGSWAVGETLEEARVAAGRVPGRRSGRPVAAPLDPPAGEWALILATSWVEPGYLEPDASWCLPGGEPASPMANGGAFGAKVESAAPGAARRLADRHGRAVRVVYGREDVVRLGPKRPPLAAGVRPDGTGIVRVVRTPGIAPVLAAAAPLVTVEEVDVAGPPTSAGLRGAGWAEMAVLHAGLAAATGGRAGHPAADGAGGSSRATATVAAPGGGSATVTVTVDGDGRPTGVGVRMCCGDPLDHAVARAYAIGAAHMGLSWVCAEGIAVDEDGRPVDLTVRSWGILRAADMPPVDVAFGGADGPPVNGSDAVFAASAAAVWIAQGLPSSWPTRRGSWRRPEERRAL